MSAQWMVYAVAMATAITLAALAAEQAARLARRPGRWIWALAMVLTVAIPLIMPGTADRQVLPPSGSAVPASTLASAPPVAASIASAISLTGSA